MTATLDPQTAQTSQGRLWILIVPPGELAFLEPDWRPAGCPEGGPVESHRQNEVQEAAWPRHAFLTADADPAIAHLESRYG
jgi:hypothetical protein